ncbi:SRPBCC domain-containing protein [Paradevosia shaoguanensis]|uniref:SRPBCC domain-containing protein n=1 Tax=Paradevosia shaoguanensis TaxID=1335043 RepID=A0AA41QKM2_9HYPH|nr:SRPBCC domain-containing protein [Paradevosia shaoguanensis]MCF1740986.1 SRPBCC domain-containing protein [Paradevosia shaoguanensis]MCI0125469.1 SRPBCC domain-containing protein [Paradevosia shaoguanensis]
MARSAELRDDELLIDKMFDAPAALVFRLWSDPVHFVRWWGPKGFTCPSAKLDFRVGGHWEAAILSPDWPPDSMAGVYREIVPNERLVFTFKWAHEGAIETLVTVTWREEGGRTRQSFHQTPFTSVEERDSHVGGWTECLDKEKAYVEALAGTEAA